MLTNFGLYDTFSRIITNTSETEGASMDYLKSRKLENWLGLLGVASYIVSLCADLISPSAYPGYNRMSQAMSDLFALNAPSRELWTQFTTVSTACGLVFATLACLYVQNRLTRTLRVGIYLLAVLSWINNLGYILFPLTKSGYAGTFQDVIHTFIVTPAVVILSISSLIVIMVGGYRHCKYRSIAIFATISLCGLIIGTIGIGVAPLTYFGIMERISVFSASGFSFVLGFYVFIGFDLAERKLQTVSADGAIAGQS